MHAFGNEGSFRPNLESVHVYVCTIESSRNWMKRQELLPMPKRVPRAKAKDHPSRKAP